MSRFRIATWVSTGLILLVWVSCIQGAEQHPFRIWTSKQGSKLEARYQSVDSQTGEIVLQTKAGKQLRVKASKISAGDLAYCEMIRTDPGVNAPQRDLSEFLVPKLCFGLRLGERKDMVVYRCEQVDIRIHKIADHEWTMAGAVNENEDVESSTCTFYKDRTVQISVVFRDASQKSFDHIAGILESQYKDKKEDPKGLIKRTFSVGEGKQRMDILLQRDQGILPEEDLMVLRFTHAALLAALDRDKAREKAEKKARNK